MNKQITSLMVAIPVLFIVFVSSFFTVIGLKLYEGATQRKQDEFKTFIYKAMDRANANLSPAKKDVIADTIVRISDSIFDTLAQKEVFVALIAVESAFNPDAVSKSGAVGLTQVLPKYVPSFVKRCNLPEVSDKDIKDITINLSIGGCVLKTLIDDNNRQVTLALISYNSGPSGHPIKQLKSGNNIANIEAASYSVKISYILDSLKMNK